MSIFNKLFGNSNKKMDGAGYHYKKDRYHCEEYGFSVYYPNGWVLQTQGLPDILRFYHVQVMFCDPLCVDNCVNVAACRIFRGRSIKELEVVPTMYAQIFGGRILSLKRTKVDNVEAIKVTYKLQKQTQKQVIFDKGSYGYIFTSGAPSNKFKDCEPIFNECLQSFKVEHITDYAGTHYFSGVSYQQRGLYKDAEKEYLKAIELDPDYYKAYCNLGAICMKTQRGEEAEKYYKKSLQINPKDPITLLNIGSIYFADKTSEDEGLKYFCKAIVADSAVEPVVHQKIHIWSYYPNKDIQKLNKLIDEELRKIYLKD